MRHGFSGTGGVHNRLLRQGIVPDRVGTMSLCLTHDFSIGERSFLLDGEPFVIRCGEVHFPRVPREYWRHRLQMCRALGLNAVCVYLFWNFHEWDEGVFDWEGQADAAEFCRLAQEEGLWVLLRPGPYSCAEWEMGGLPWWLVRHESIGLRSTDPRFLEPAARYLKEVGRVLAPLQINHGGPILMVQVENEYGSFGKDAAYMGALRDALIESGFQVPLFACNPVGDLANGHRDDLFQVVNFGKGAGQDAFSRLREFQPTGPLMNGEYYPAWFDMWGRKHRTGAPEPIVADLREMLDHGRSFSVYMAHGGTSFGLWAGADRPFSPDTTSYDYDAPISEAGWTTPKFEAIRKLMAHHLQSGESLPPAPPANPVIEIPSFALTEAAALFENLPCPRKDKSPKTMEAYGQSRGATVYRTVIPAGAAGRFTARAVHDFAWAFLDGQPIGVMDRRSATFQLELPTRTAPARLDLLVYAMGRVNFGEEILDRKGLHAPILLDGNEVEDWEIFAFPMDREMLDSLRYGRSEGGPAFWRGEFHLETTGDTFLDTRAWGKGIVWVNGRCLGRMWNLGPTQTLYVPGPWLRKGRNEVVVFDLLGPREPILSGLNAPILDQLRPDLDFLRAKRATGTFKPTTPVASGTFPSEGGRHAIRFAQPTAGRYLCLEALSCWDGGLSCAVADLDAIAPSGASLHRGAWKILWVSSEETQSVAGDSENAIDGQTSTAWHSQPGLPHRIVIDLGETQTLAGVRYLPTPGEGLKDRWIREYRIYFSDESFLGL